jgi:hypothetical protein
MNQRYEVVLTYTIDDDEVISGWTEEEQRLFHDGDVDALMEFESQAIEAVLTSPMLCDECEVSKL